MKRVDSRGAGGKETTCRVILILPDCSFVVQRRKEEPKYFVVHVKQLETPPPKSKHSFDSWLWMRDNLLGNFVKIRVDSAQLAVQQSGHEAKEVPTPLGPLKRVNVRVALKRTGCEPVDVLKEAIINGAGKLFEGGRAKESRFYQQLKAFEAQAKEKRVGVWNDKDWFDLHPGSYTPDEILQQRVFHEALVDRFSRDGTCIYLTLLPKRTKIMLRLAGVSRLTGAECTEEVLGNVQETLRERLQQRKVSVRVIRPMNRDRASTKAHSYPTFLGSLMDKSDAATQFLLRDGVVKFGNETARFCPNADLYVKAEIEARKGQKNIWAKETYTEIKSPDFEGICTGVDGTNGLVLSQGDTQRVVHFSCLKLPFFYDLALCDNWGWETRQFLGRRFIGKKIRATITGSWRGERDYGVLHTETGTVHEDLLRHGWAQLTEPCVGERIPNWAELKQLEDRARAEKVGQWSDAKPLNHNDVVDLTGSGESKKLSEFFQSVKGQTLQAEIEDIRQGPQLQLLFPERKVRALLHVAQIEKRGRDDKYAQDLIRYAKEKYLYCSALVTLTGSLDFCVVGEVVVNCGESSVNVAEDLVSRGFVKCKKNAGSALPCVEKLLRLEEEATVAGVGIWADKTLCKHRFYYGRSERVRVVSVWDSVTIGVQLMDQGMSAVDNILKGRERFEPITKAQVSDCVLARRFIGDVPCYVRARICQLKKARTGGENAIVKLIDFSEPPAVVPVSYLYQMPPEVAKIEPQGRTICLACCQPSTDAQAATEAVNKIWTACQDAVLYLHLIYKDDRAHVLLTDSREITSGSLNAFLISQGLVNAVPHEVKPEFQDIVQKLMTANASPEGNA